MKTQIHELRTRIDGLAQLITTMTIETVEGGWRKTVSMSSEITDCHKSILLSKAWLGEVLSELGEETPYKNDGNRKTVEDIEPTADRFKVPELIDCGTGFDFTSLTYIEKIDWLREEIKKVLSLTDDLFDPEDEVDDWPGDECYKAIDHLTEALFLLGFELSRIKEQSK